MPSDYQLDIQRSSIASGALTFTKSDLQGRFDQYLSYLPAGGFPISGAGVIDPGEVYKFSADSLSKFVDREMKGVSIPKEVISYVASGGGGRGVNMRIPEIATLTEALSQMGGTAVLQKSNEIFQNTPLKIPPGIQSIGMMSVDQLLSGKPPIDKFKAIGVGVGAMAGAKLGSILGTVYPGIGNVIGAAVGAMVSALFSSLPSKQPPPPPQPVNPAVFKSGREAELAQRRFEELNKIRNDYLSRCEAQSRQYWTSFDKAFHEFSLAWSKKELEYGFKFPLRWFDDTLGPAFYADPVELRKIGAQWAYLYKAKSIDPKVASSAMKTAEQADYYTYLVKGTKYTNCRLSTMGCAYPTNHRALYPRNDTFGEDREYATFSGFKTSQAYAARGAIWVPENMRIDCNRELPYPLAREYETEEGTRKYEKDITTISHNLTSRDLRLSVAMQQVNADLVRTATIYKSYLDMLGGSAVYGKNFKASQIDGAFQEVLEKNNMFNNVAMGAGLGVLGFSLWRAFR